MSEEPFPRTTALISSMQSDSPDSPEDTPIAAAAPDESEESDVPFSLADPVTLADVYNLLYDVDDKLDRLLEQNNFLGSNMVPAVADLHRKFDGASGMLNAFIAMVGQAKIPGLSRALKGGAFAHASQAEEGRPAGE